MGKGEVTMVSVPGFSHTYDVFFVNLRWSCESAIVSHILDCLGRDLWDGDRGSWIVDRCCGLDLDAVGEPF
jgi:hypothetical protein